MAFRNPGGIKFAQLPTVPPGNVGGTNQSLVIRTSTGGAIVIETLDSDAGILDLIGAAGVSLQGPFVGMDADRMYLSGPISPTQSFEPANVIESDDSGDPLMRLFVDDNGHMILSGGGTAGNGPSMEFASDGTALIAGKVGKQLQFLGDTTIIGATTELQMASPTQTTVGAAGAASALPAQPRGYLKARIGGTVCAIPFYIAA